MTQDERILSALGSLIAAIGAMDKKIDQLDSKVESFAPALESLNEQMGVRDAAVVEAANSCRHVHEDMIDERRRNEAAHANIRARLERVEIVTNVGR